MTRDNVADQATKSLERVVEQIRGDLDTAWWCTSRRRFPRGLTELVDQHGADLVVVGSSSSGLLGRVALGSVTERLVHTAKVPVAIAPRGYPLSPVPVQRLTAAYGGAADAVGLITTSAELAKKWSVRLRIASFTVRPVTMYGGSIERSAENLVVKQWTRKTMDAALEQLEDARRQVEVPDVDVVIGAGTDWRDAVDGIAWQSGDLLLLGSGAAGPVSQVFLGRRRRSPATRAGAGDDRATAPHVAGRTGARPGKGGVTDAGQRLDVRGIPHRAGTRGRRNGRGVYLGRSPDLPRFDAVKVRLCPRRAGRWALRPRKRFRPNIFGEDTDPADVAAQAGELGRTLGAPALKPGTMFDSMESTSTLALSEPPMQPSNIRRLRRAVPRQRLPRTRRCAEQPARRPARWCQADHTRRVPAGVPGSAPPSPN